MVLKNRIVIFICVIILLTSFASAFLGTYERGSTISVRGNLNATSVNVTIYFPNTTIAIDNQPMTQLKEEIWNYTFNATDDLGEYIYDYCDQNGRNCLTNNFDVTITGTVLDTADSINYLILIIGVLFFFILCLYWGITLPLKNERNSENKIISVQKLKYLKISCLFVSFLLFIWLANLLFALANNFEILSSYSKFFEVIFIVLNALAYPVFVLMLIFMGSLAWKDLKLRKLLTRGLKPR